MTNIEIPDPEVIDGEPIGEMDLDGDGKTDTVELVEEMDDGTVRSTLMVPSTD